MEKAPLKKKEVKLPQIEEKEKEKEKEKEEPIEECAAEQPPPIYIELSPVYEPLISDELLLSLVSTFLSFSMGLFAGYAIFSAKKI